MVPKQYVRHRITWSPMVVRSANISKTIRHRVIVSYVFSIEQRGLVSDDLAWMTLKAISPVRNLCESDVAEM